MTIIYLCHYFAPEIGAPQARLLEMAREWVRGGHQVKVVTGFPSYPTGVIPADYRGKVVYKEVIEGIEVYRSWVYASPSESFVRKALGYLSLVITSVLLSTPRVGPADVIIVSSPPLFTGIAAWLMSRMKRIPFIFEARDLWPAAIVELGAVRNPWIIHLLEWLEMALYRRAAAIVTVTDSFRGLLEERGVPGEKIFTVTNGVDENLFAPQNGDNRFRLENGLTGKFVVLYVGTHGVSQGLSQVVDVAVRCRDRESMVFVFVGEGAYKSVLVEKARTAGLSNVLFLPLVEKSRIPEVYAAADVCLVPLRDIPVFRRTIPSKIFEILAMGRPILASLAGEAAVILAASGGAIVVAPEDVSGMEAAVCSLAQDPDLCARLSSSGRSFVLSFYTRTILAAKYLGILAKIVPTADAVPGVRGTRSMESHGDTP